MTSLGKVRVWHRDDGWGVIDSEVTPGGCWAGFSSVLVAGLRSLENGQAVMFDFEAAEQDGFAFLAVAVWPAGQEPVHIPPITGRSAAYGSMLRIAFDDDGNSRS